METNVSSSTAINAERLRALRVDYSRQVLDDSAVSHDPFQQFTKWLNEALAVQLPEPNAMTLATADADGAPSARIVLLKDFDARGFTFYTNYASRKGRELAANPRASLVFLWTDLERQVRIDGSVERVTREESKAYFDVRPRLSRIGAWASKQSDVVASREQLEASFREMEARFPDEIPLPETWGGYRVIPSAIEFWQGRRSRLHDRLLYTRSGDQWKISRLSP